MFTVAERDYASKARPWWSVQDPQGRVVSVFRNPAAAFRQAALLNWFRHEWLREGQASGWRSGVLEGRRQERERVTPW